MGTHYIIDAHASPITSAEINDVLVPTDGRSPIAGSFVIRVPNGISVKNPTNVSDLLTKKYQGLLASYAGFKYIDYDDLLDASHVDTSYGMFKGTYGERSTISVEPGHTFQSLVTTLTAPAPSQAIVLWETFEYEDTDIPGERFVRVYHELDNDTVSMAQASFDNGTSYVPISPGGVVNIPSGSQGTAFIIRITNTSSSRILLGSWAVIY